MNHLDKNAILEASGEDFSIGIHNVIPGYKISEIGRLNAAKKICTEGLKVNASEGGTAATVRLFGLVRDVKTEDLERYFYGFPYQFDLLERWLDEGNDEFIGTVVLIPSIIKDREGESYFVGDYPDFYGMGISSAEQKNQRGMMFPMEQYIKTIGYIPKEFILGYMHTTKSNMNFHVNEHFIGLQDTTIQEEFYDSLITDMILKGSGISKDFCKEDLEFVRKFAGYPTKK